MSLPTFELKSSYLNKPGCANCSFNNNELLISDVERGKDFWNEHAHDIPVFDC